MMIFASSSNGGATIIGVLFQDCCFTCLAARNRRFRCIVQERSLHIRIWPILIVGFGALISLIGLSGWLAYARSKSTYAGISEFYRSEHDSQKALTQIRSDIDRSAILLRDFLLDVKLSAAAAKLEMAELRTSTEDQLNQLQHLIPSSQSEHLTRLRRQATSYWLS